MQEALARRNVVPFRPRTWWKPALQAAALLVTGVGGFLLARASAPPAQFPVAGVERAEPRSVAVVSERQLDASRVGLDLSGNPRLLNVAFRPSEADGRLSISFDVTTRYHVSGRAEDQNVASLLAYVVNAGAATEGARGRAIDLVSRELGERAAAAPEIVEVLVRTLKDDGNPGVRKKAAEVLVQLPPSPAIRDALALALRKDANPAVRMIAVEGLAKAATTLRDPLSIETLREKAGDETEPGFVRVKAASALREIPL
ncbi:MAG: HEAT repeat domain-containing protein [Thermoanaerobaculia bacterium]